MIQLQNHERLAIIWDLNVSPTEKLILLALDSYASSTGRECFPSTKRLSQKTGFTRQTISKTLATLEDKGFITKTYRFENNRQTSNDYQLLYGKMKTSAIKDDVKNLTPPVNYDDTPCKLRLHPPVNEADTDQSNKTRSNYLKDAQENFSPEGEAQPSSLVTQASSIGSGLENQSQSVTLEQKQNDGLRSESVKPTRRGSHATARVQSKHQQIEAMIADAAGEAMEDFLQWRGDRLAATQAYEHLNGASADSKRACVVNFYAKKLNGFSDAEKEQARIDVLDLIASDVQQCPKMAKKKADSRFDAAMHEIFARYKESPEAAFKFAQGLHLWNKFQKWDVFLAWKVNQS